MTMENEKNKDTLIPEKIDPPTLSAADIDTAEADRIRGIVAVIDEISEEVNLLASKPAECTTGSRVALPAGEAKKGTEKTTTSPPEKVLRFRKSERIVHWAIAIPFLVCWTTALLLVIFYNPHPLRPYRDLFSWIHRISGICLIVLPILAVAKAAKGDYKLHFYNIRQAWKWTWDDIKWLSLMGLAAVSSKIRLPEQGKFNAAEKINFMIVMSTYPLYIMTGLVVWLTDVTFLAWLVHFSMAVIATPILLGHIYMAAINPGSRKALEGMINGFVDRQWAKHHHRHWYREQFENPTKNSPSDVP